MEQIGQKQKGNKINLTLVLFGKISKQWLIGPYGIGSEIPPVRLEKEELFSHLHAIGGSVVISVEDLTRLLKN